MNELFSEQGNFLQINFCVFGDTLTSNNLPIVDLDVLYTNIKQPPIWAP